jgi:PKD repeat protein
MSKPVIYPVTADSATSQSKVAVLPEFKEVIQDKGLKDTFTANFNAGTEIAGLRYEWSLGDDSVQNGASISHTYSKIDTYVVKLKVYDTTIEEPAATTQRVWHPPLSAGQSVIRPQLGSEELALEEETWVTIWRKAPKAKFKYTTNGGENIPVAKLAAGSTSVSFDASETTDENINNPRPLKYIWNFGDTVAGATPVVEEKLTPTTQHSYTREGRFLITLTVKNRFELSNIYRAYIHVRDPKSNLRINVNYPQTSPASVPIGPQTLEVLQQEQQKLEEQQLGQDVVDFEANRPTGYRAKAPNSPPLNASQIQAMSATALDTYFPYAIHGSATLRSAVFRPIWEDGVARNSFCSSMTIYRNGRLASSPFNVIGAPGEDQLNPFLCRAIFSNNLGGFANTPNINTVIATGVYLETMDFRRFDELVVPEVAIAIMPDHMLPGKLASPHITEEYYDDEASGKRRALLTVRIRESEAGSLIDVKVPVYAATSDGRFTTSANGIFNAKFLDQTSDCGDCVMVNGEASITVKIDPSQYGKEGAKLNLSRIQTFAKEPCGFEDINSGKAKAFNSSLNGCATINTIKDFPTVNAPDDIPKYPFDLKEASSFFGHVLVGENGTKMKAFYKYLEEGFWEDAKDFAFMFIPLAGSIDGFVKAANKCSEEGGCDVNGLILSGVAAIAESTLGGRVIVKTLGATFKGIYKLGKMAVNSPGGKAIVDGFTIISQELKQLGGLTAEVVAEKYGQALATTLDEFQKFGGKKYIKRAGEIVNELKTALGKSFKETWEKFTQDFQVCPTSGNAGITAQARPPTICTTEVHPGRGTKLKLALLVGRKGFLEHHWRFVTEA